MKRVLILVFSLVLSLSITVQRGNACDQLNYWTSDDIALAMSTKLARGITNVATGWMEFPRAFYVTGRDDGIAKGIFLGPFQGIFMTVVRTLTGAVELGSFVVPAPGCYDPFLDRPLVWSYNHQQEGLLIFNKDRSDRKYHLPPEPKTSEEPIEPPLYEPDGDVDENAVDEDGDADDGDVDENAVDEDIDTDDEVDRSD